MSKPKAPKNQVKEGKPRPSLIPMDLLMELLCPAYEEGVIKYARESWRLGFDYSIMYDACIRHLKSFYFDKEIYDPETLKKYGIKKHHIGAAIFSLISLYISDRDHPELDDRGIDHKRLEELMSISPGVKVDQDIETKYINSQERQDTLMGQLTDILKKGDCSELHKQYSDKDAICPICGEPFNPNF